MASSNTSNAGSSHQEQREQKVLDVIFLCDEWKSSKGGLSTFNREFAINLAQATTGSMKIHCYVSNSDDQDREDAEQHGVNLITARSVPGSADPLECLKFPPSKLPKPHLVIGHGRKLGSPAYFLAQSTKCKWIQFVHVYCEDLGKYKESATAAEDTIEENEKKHKMEIELCKAADAVVAVGSRLQQKYSRRLLNVEVKIITPGIFGKFSNESKLAIDRSVVKNFNVSLFGRAAFEDLSLKGYDVVANAIGSLGKNFELTFVGSSPGEQRKVEQWFLDNTCINRNQLTIRRYCSEQEELKVMFYQSDLVALPSRTEGFGLVALEAISAGVPVLVSGESGIAEALQKVEGGNTVIVGSGEDKDEWARRIREMYEESAEEREVNAVKLRENYRKVYSWKEECERFKGLIENVVKTANGGEMNIKVDVNYLKPEEQNMQTGMLATESVRCQEVQQPRASATSAAFGSVSYPLTEDLYTLRVKTFLSIIKDSFHTMKPQSIEEGNQFMEYAKEMKVIIVGVSDGSLVITVKCESLKILEDLWTDYSSGHLGEVVQNCFVTEKILKELNLADLRLKTTMDEEEYNVCKMFFEKDALRDALSTEFHSTSSISESPQKKEQWEKSEQKTKIMETVELEGMLPLLESSTSDPEEELEELRMKLQIMKGASSSEFHSISSTSESPQTQEELKKWKQKTKIVETEKLKGTSPLTVTPTTGHGIELLEIEQGRKGMLPLLGSSTSDSEESEVESFTSDSEEEPEVLRRELQIMKDSLSPLFLHTTDLEEKLFRLCANLEMLRVEGGFPVLQFSTVDLEKKLGELSMEFERPRMKGTLPPPELFTADLEKELEQLRTEVNRLRMIGSSHPLVSTTEIELDELLKQLQKWRKEGSFPVLQFSTIDLEKKLDELSMELQRLRMEGTLPSPELLTADLEEKLKELLTELERQRDKGSLPPTFCTIEVGLDELLNKLQKRRMEGALSSELHSTSSTSESPQKKEQWEKSEQKTKIMETEKLEGTSPLIVVPTTGHGKELEERWGRKGMLPLPGCSTFDLEKELEELRKKLQTMKGSLHSLHSLPTTDLKEKLEQVFEEFRMLRMKGGFSVLQFSTIDLEKKLAELRMKLQRLRMEGTLPPPELFTADLEDELLQLFIILERRERMKGSSRSLFLTTYTVLRLHQELKKGRMEALENAMYPIIRAGLAKFDVSLPGELQNYVSYLLNESAKLHFRKQVPQSPLALEELREAMDKDELKTFLTIHIREGAWQVVLLFMDELPRVKLPWDWCGILHYGDEDEDEVVSNKVIYSSTSGILNGWPTHYDPGLVTLCKAITNKDWKVTRLISSRSRIPDEGLKNLSTALTQSELYSLTLYDIDLQSQGLEHLCNALNSVHCRLTNLNVRNNKLGDVGIMHLCNALTSVDCTLTSLNVSHSELGDLGIRRLCNALASVNCRLTSLNVSNNQLGDNGLKHLCDALTSSNCALTKLKVGFNRLGDGGMKELSEVLTNGFCTLTSLDICGNEFGDEGIKLLCKALTDTKCKLRSLNLWGNWYLKGIGKKYLSQLLTGTDWEDKGALRLSRSTTK